MIGWTALTIINAICVGINIVRGAWWLVGIGVLALTCCFISLYREIRGN